LDLSETLYVFYFILVLSLEEDSLEVLSISSSAIIYNVDVLSFEEYILGAF
jgi:hypothetical protein